MDNRLDSIETFSATEESSGFQPSAVWPPQLPCRIDTDFLTSNKSPESRLPVEPNNIKSNQNQQPPAGTVTTTWDHYHSQLLPETTLTSHLQITLKRKHKHQHQDQQPSNQPSPPRALWSQLHHIAQVRNAKRKREPISPVFLTPNLARSHLTPYRPTEFQSVI